MATATDEIVTPKVIATAKRMAAVAALKVPSLADEFESAALYAVADCADRFDPGREANFFTFAVPRIRGAIQDAMRQSRPRGYGRRGDAPAVFSLHETMAISDGSDRDLAAIDLVAADELPVGWEIESEDEVRALLGGGWKARAVARYFLEAPHETLKATARTLGLSESRLSQIRGEVIEEIRGMAKQFESQDLSQDEIQRRIAAVRAAKRRAIEAGKPAHTLSDEEIDQAIGTAETVEKQQVATATSNGQAAPPKCEWCGREKTPKGLGYWCKPCRDDELTRAKGREPETKPTALVERIKAIPPAPSLAPVKRPEPTPVVNPRPVKPTYEQQTALERQQKREPAPALPAVVDQVVPLVAVEPARPVVDEDFGEMLREMAAMRALVETLGPLRPSTRTRVVRWLADRFDGGAA